MGRLRKNSIGILFYDSYVDSYSDGVKSRKRKRISLGTRDIKMARAKLSELKIELEDYKDIQSKAMEDFQRDYVKWAELRHAPSTVKNFEGVLRKIAELIPVKAITQIERRHAESFIMTLAQGMTARGVNFYLRTARAIFNDALEWNLIYANPFAGIKLLKEKTIKPRILSVKELSDFFRKAAELHPNLIELFQFYLLTGLRRSEAIELEMVDVNFETSSMLVHGKGDKYRVVPLMPLAKAILMGKRDQARPFPWAGDTVTHAFREIRQAAGIERAKLHDLRKTFATMLMDYGISHLAIKNWLGHEDDQITRRHYLGYNDVTTTKKMKQLEKSIRTNLPIFPPLLK
jgi:integrase